MLVFSYVSSRAKVRPISAHPEPVEGEPLVVRRAHHERLLLSRFFVSKC